MRGIHLIAGLIFATGLLTASARATETIIKVELQDSTSDAALQGMHMKLDRNAIKAGPVTFRVTNESQALVHETLVLKTGLDVSKLPYDPKEDKFRESKVKSLGEVEELQPGKSGKLTLNLQPGSYLLTCNQPGHLHAGMWTKLTVTR